MQDSYKIVYTGGFGEIVEKKSRFIATILPIETEEDALLSIDQIKKKHWDASHNCFAYVLGRKNELERCSDDGEPSQTAGRPMLDVLIKEGIHNVAVVVTRYFGGTLLGTGGLVRAYQGATKEGLKNCTLLEKNYGKQLLIKTDYTGLGKIQNIAGTLDLTTLTTEFTDIVVITLLVPPNLLSSATQKIQEATNGKVVLSELDDVYYGNLQNKILIFPD
jgi:uncharacterized YigZ family protein